MRVILADHDSALLTNITQTLSEYFTIDAVTNKADCLDLLRVNDFDVIVAGERLEDGSGLELLGQLERNRPDMLRIFAIERERLKLLKGRLKPFGLFRTLSYPIEPRQLLAALAAAAGVDDELEKQLQEMQAASSVAADASALSNDKAGIQSQTTSPVSEPVRPEPPPGRHSAPATQELDSLRPRPLSNSKHKNFPPPSMQASGRRSVFLVAAGIALIMGGAMVLATRLSKTSDDEPIRRTILSAPVLLRSPPEVVQLVADTQTALQHDDIKAARTDIAALQQIAPTHPQLPFLESILEKEEAAASSLAKPESSARRAPPRKAGTRISARQPVPAAAIFSGKTVEENNNAPPSAERRD